MSDNKKKSKRRKDEYSGPNGAEKSVEKATKDEYKVAKWIKSNVPTKRTKFLNHNVEYFTATKALDALMTSKFAQGDACLFATRERACRFLDSMLVHRFFHRAKKVPVTEAELKRGKRGTNTTDKDGGGGGNNSDKGGGKDKGDNKEVDKKKLKEQDNLKQRNRIINDDEGNKLKGDSKGTNNEDGETSPVESGGKIGGVGDKTSGVTGEKKKRKIRLDMHPDQVFIDGNEPYVWIYDPIPIHYWLFGALLVVGAIVICLFPLWPPSLRKGVYYLSIAAAGFLVFILSLAVIRFIVFCFVWLISGSKHHFWLFPNLTEDVGFFASFWPLYRHEVRSGGEDDGKKLKKRKKDKNSDDEAEDVGDESADKKNLNQESQVDDDDEENHNIDEINGGNNLVDVDDDEEIDEDEENPNVEDHIDLIGSKSIKKPKGSPSESESESSQSTGKDFEVVDPNEIVEHEKS